jgi:hypothetical protein
LAIFRNLIFFVLFPIQAARKAMANAQWSSKFNLYFRINNQLE